MPWFRTCPELINHRLSKNCKMKRVLSNVKKEESSLFTRPRQPLFLVIVNSKRFFIRCLKVLVVQQVLNVDAFNEEG
jgi:hypothetical protein